MNGDAGLDQAIRASGGTKPRARALDVTAPTASSWRHIPEHDFPGETLTHVARNTLLPDRHPGTPLPDDDGAATAVRDETDLARAQEYAMLAALLLRPPDAQTLARLSRLQESETPLGRAHAALAEAASAAVAETVEREYFELFIGVGRSELLPYASYYLTGFLNERPLAGLRGDLRRLGLERAEGHFDPEDHLGTLCEIMSGFCGGAFEASAAEERAFFDRHLSPWAGRCFADLENASLAGFYRSVGAVGRIFIDIEAEGFAMEARTGA